MNVHHLIGFQMRCLSPCKCYFIMFPTRLKDNDAALLTLTASTATSYVISLGYKETTKERNKEKGT